MKIINWTLAILIAFQFVACTSGNDQTKKQEVISQTTKTTNHTTETVSVKTDVTAERGGDAAKADAVPAETPPKATEVKKMPTPKPKKTTTSKPKQAVEKVKETVKQETEKAKASAEKVIEKTKEVVKITTTAVTEAPAKVVEKIKEVVKTPPSAPEPITKPAVPKVVETPKAVEAPKVEKPVEKVEAPSAPKPVALSHDAWDGLLRKYVSASGTVNYGGFKTDKAKLENYLGLLAANPPQAAWERSKAMAYWINAYNAFTVKLIVDNYPVGSITDLEGGKPWSKRWIKLGSQTYSLDQIEKEILLKKYKDARVHFAVNCAAKSCPALLNQAWTASNLESNFERQTKQFINNPQFNEISPKSAKISQLFNWYASDFGDVTAFINKYSSTQLKSNAKIDFMEYNWKLNE